VVVKRQRSTVVGLSVSASAVRMVVLEHGRIVRADEVGRSQHASLEEAVDILLRELVPSRLGRTQVFAAVDLSHAQVRNIGQMAWSKDRVTARAIVQQNPERLFVVNGIPVSATDVQTTATGAWIAVIETHVIEALTVACGIRDCELRVVSPVAAVLGYVAEVNRIVWHDDDHALLASYDGAELSSYRRLRVADATELPPEAQLADAAALRAIGDDGYRFAGALGAARARASVAMAIRLEPSVASLHARVRVAAVAVALAAILAVMLPPTVVSRRATRANSEYVRLARSAERAEGDARELADGVRTIEEMNAFARSTRSATLLLASLTNAIEHPAMLLSIQVDTLGGTLNALTPRASVLMAMLDSVPEIANPRIVGPVTQEAAMERVTARFAWRSQRPAAPSLRKVP
jgi:hypothetical protein